MGFISLQDGVQVVSSGRPTLELGLRADGCLRSISVVLKASGTPGPLSMWEPQVMIIHVREQRWGG